MENKPPYTTVIREAVLYCRELLENYFNERFQYHYYHDFKSSDKENILIVDFPLSVWEDAITDTFVKYFRGVKILPEVKTYFDSWLSRIELSSGTARFNTDGLIVAGVKFENGVIAKKLAECITLALQPQMTTFGQPTRSTGECIPPQPQQLPQPDPTTTDAGKAQRTIDTERLKEYFVLKFKCEDDTGYCPFDEMVKILKNVPFTEKQYAQIARIMWGSKQKKNPNMSYIRPTTFVRWHKIFLGCIGMEQTKTYKPAALHKTMSEDLLRLFQMLL
jgi:hypothetical protein